MHPSMSLLIISNPRKWNWTAWNAYPEPTHEKKKRTVVNWFIIGGATPDEAETLGWEADVIYNLF